MNAEAPTFRREVTIAIDGTRQAECIPGIATQSSKRIHLAIQPGRANRHAGSVAFLRLMTFNIDVLPFAILRDTVGLDCA